MIEPSGTVCAASRAPQEASCSATPLPKQARQLRWAQRSHVCPKGFDGAYRMGAPRVGATSPPEGQRGSVTHYRTGNAIDARNLAGQDEVWCVRPQGRRRKEPPTSSGWPMRWAANSLKPAIWSATRLRGLSALQAWRCRGKQRRRRTPTSSAAAPGYQRDHLSANLVAQAVISADRRYVASRARDVSGVARSTSSISTGSNTDKAARAVGF